MTHRQDFHEDGHREAARFAKRSGRSAVAKAEPAVGRLLSVALYGSLLAALLLSLISA